MPTPSPSWNSVRVHGTWVNQDGSLKAGSYKVSIPVRVTNDTDDVIIPAGTFATGTLNTTNGLPSFDLQIPATDDPDNSPPFQVRIEITFPDALGEMYQIDVPVALKDDANGLDLEKVVLTSTFTPVETLVKGIPGGVAELDAQGFVLDASGTRVTGGGAVDLSGYATTDSVTTGLATKVNSSTYTAGLAAKADASALTSEASTARAAEGALRNLSDSAFSTALSATFVGLPDSTNLRPATSRLAGRATSQFRSVWMGHSFVAGQGATTRAQNFVSRIDAALQAHFNVQGAPGAGTYIPAWDGRTDAKVANFTTEAGAAVMDVGWGYGDKTVKIPAGTRIKFNAFYGTSFSLSYGKQNSSPTVTVSIDGVDQPTFDATATSSGDGFVWTSPALPLGWHTVRVSSAVGSFVLNGLHPYNGNEAKGLHTIPAGHSAYTTNDFLTNLSTTFPGLVNRVNSPHLFGIMCLVNDYSTGIAPATTQANLVTIINAVKTNTPVAPPAVVVVAEWQRADAGFTPVAAWSEYVAAAKAAAATTGAIFIDLSAMVPNTSASPDIYGIVGADNVHPTDKGHQFIADAIVGRLLRDIGPVPSTSDASNQPGKLIAGLRYKPSVTTNKTTTSASIVDIDATNLAVTFAAPASGNVSVQVTANVGLVGAGFTLRLALREASAVVAGSVAFILEDASPGRSAPARMYVSGLTPGQLYTWKLAWSVNSASATGTMYIDANRPVEILVIDAGKAILELTA